MVNMVNLFVVITVTFLGCFPIGRNSGPFSPYTLCLRFIGKGGFQISVLNSEFSSNMLRCDIVSKYYVLINSYRCQNTCWNIHVRLIWNGYCFISNFYQNIFLYNIFWIWMNYLMTYSTLSVCHTLIKYHLFIYCVAR